MSGSILILNRWPQYPDSERWDNKLARYGDIIPHDRYRVTYICDPPGRQGVLAGSGGGGPAIRIHLVPDFADIDRLAGVVKRLIETDGPFDHVIGLSEYLLDVAAQLRERCGIPGPRPAYVDRFRDKTVMKTILRKAGVPTPRWFPCESPEQVLAVSEALGFPLIVKPVRGASSKDVSKVNDPAELEAVLERIGRNDRTMRGFEIEEYIAGEVLHADGVVDRSGACLFMSVSRYISPCLDFEAGAPLGSIIQTEPALYDRCRHFALRCLAALDLRASAFHLEFFDTGRDLVFLEIGARVPGADVSYVIHDVYGVNLFKLWVDVVLGHEVKPVDCRSSVGGQSGGWVTIPRPQPLPQTVLRATPLLGKIPFLYRELVPRPGQMLEDAGGGYANLQGGRFLFGGGTESQIAEAIHAAIDAYELTTEPATIAASPTTTAETTTTATATAATAALAQ
ncbi:MAG TPA: ATP-grasp domain-containing protein [Stellaceae bacterium]